MVKNKYAFTALLLFTIAIWSYLLTGIYVQLQTKEESDKKVVVTSFYPMYVATANIVGESEGIEVKCLSEPQTGCLHDFQLTPKDMKLLSKADVFVVNGGGMESFLGDVKEQYPELSIVSAMVGEDIEEVHEAEVHEDVDVKETLGHSHAEHHHTNNHLWMSVSHYREQVVHITKALCEVYKEDAEAFLKNAKEYDAKLMELEQQQKEIALKIAGQKVISFHDAYAFVAEDFDLDLAYTLNLDEERQVSAGEVAEVLAVIGKESIPVIFAEEIYGKELVTAVQKECNVKVCYLDTLVRGDYSLNSYLYGMQENIKRIGNAFGVE